VVAPSLPGYAFSGPTTAAGWNVRRIAEAWAVLMAGLGYGRYGAQGGDWGSMVSRHLADVDRDHVCAVHVNMWTSRLTGEPGEMEGLTERELGIVRAVARGLSNEAISKELWVAEQTVKFHLTNIYRKLGVTNRTEAARYAFEQGLVEPEPDSALTH